VIPALLATEFSAGTVSFGGTALGGCALLAAGGWEQVIVAMVAIGIWALNQFLGARNKPAPPPRRGPAPGPGQPGQPAAGQPAGQKGLLDEVEQFLKDARKQMEQQQQRPQQQPQPQQAQARPQQAQTRPQQVQAQPRQSPRPQQQSRKQKQQSPRPQPRPPEPSRPLVESRPLGDRSATTDDRATTVDDHVREHMGTDRFDTSRFDERAGKLSNLQQTIDQDIGAHVRSVFDHQVGTMTTGSALSGPAAEVPAGPNAVQQLLALLRDPQGVRNAILLQEILKPPAERW
jgi:outer membrane biosynthesis protein TonB